MAGDGSAPLFETKEARGRIPYKIFAISVFVGVCMIWVYRCIHVPEKRRWVWFGMFGAEVWFGLYWISTQAVRWRPVYRTTFKERLSKRYEDELPGVDIFVCTADPKIEPPILVINTVLSVMAYDYPKEKLSVYLSDDGGSDLTFYALLEASTFSRHWLPFCRKFKVDPTAPAAYFSTSKYESNNKQLAEEWLSIKDMHEKMENRIETAVKLGCAPEDVRAQVKGFFEWNSVASSRDHQAILQILVDGRDPTCVDNEGSRLPTLVYLAREKRPGYPHNFKAGALNALIRVSSVISNWPIILTLDCDMYSNNAQAVRDVLCFFMDEDKGHEIGFVQCPQGYDNVNQNDIYSHSFKVINELEFPGMDGNGGPLYIGSGAFFRRESLCGSKYSEECKGEWKRGIKWIAYGSAVELEDRAKALAGCTSEENTQWGKEMGLKYGCLVEDVITGLAIHCRGWKSAYFNPSRKAFLGVAPATLEQTLVQHKRWTEGHLQVLFTKHCAFIQGHGKISLGHQLSYSVYNAWPVNAIPTLIYAVFPSLALLNGIYLFPSMSSPWFWPFFYVISASYAYSLVEGLWFGETLRSLWHQQRMWLYKRLSAYFFATIDATLQLLGLGKTAFVVSAKATDDEVGKRYEEEKMEFGSNSPMFTVLSTVAMLNFFSSVVAMKRLAVGDEVRYDEVWMLQLCLCVALVIINWPVYEGLFFRKDKGRLPTSVAFKSISLALLACVVTIRF